MSTIKGESKPRRRCAECYHWNILYDGNHYCMRHRKWLTPSKDNPEIPDNKQFTDWMGLDGTEQLCKFKENESQEQE